MSVLILNQATSASGEADEQDVLVQRNAIRDSLTQAGYEVRCFECTLNLERLNTVLTDLRPEFVFNLVESLGGTDQLIGLVTQLLDSIPIRYTGAGTDSICLTLDKLAAKKRMIAAGVPTPDAVNSQSEYSQGTIFRSTVNWQLAKWIIKPRREHASVGLNDDSIVEASSVEDLQEKLRFKERAFGKPMMAERFIDGREFNVSMLAGTTLPIAEIEFVDFPISKPRIVGYDAKWKADSFEYCHTQRRFEFPHADLQLLRQLAGVAKQCWNAFQLRGYARVDIRVDQAGQIFVLEVNVNPCLSPDAGFAAAAGHAGYSYDDMVAAICEHAKLEMNGCQ